MAEAIISEARRWLGTPYVHQGRVLGRGCDCIGLIYAVIAAVNPALAETIPAYRDYGPVPAGGLLCRRLAEWLEAIPTQAARPGDILALRFSADPQHAAILTERDTIIHAYQRAGRCVEHRYAGVWRARAVAAYRLPLGSR